jgi:hypothetical protein
MKHAVRSGSLRPGVSKRARLGPVAVLATGLLALALAAGAAAGGNELLAKGTVNLGYSPTNRTVSFKIHARGDGQSSEVDVTIGSSSYSYDGSTCAGSYTDPIKGGTDVYVIGALMSGPVGAPGYVEFDVHEGGPLGADFGLVDFWSSLHQAQLVCGLISTGSPLVPVIAASGLLFKA